jgi:hypothetical protein
VEKYTTISGVEIVVRKLQKLKLKIKYKKRN